MTYEADQISKLLCRVCGDHAKGYNFDQISCESCKIFFRRNAFRSLAKLKCKAFGSCVITVKTRRSCAHCRLKKCFDVKMRKEYIRCKQQPIANHTEDVYGKNLTNGNDFKRQKNKSQWISFPPAIDILTYQKEPVPTHGGMSLSSLLTCDDWSMLTNLNNTYDLWTSDFDRSYINQYSSNVTLEEFLNDEQKTYENLILFYKNIPQFQQLNLEDRILLIKCNVIDLIHIHHIIKENFSQNSKLGFHSTKWISERFHKQMTKIHCELNFFIQNPIVLKLTLVTFIFMINLSKLSFHSQTSEIQDKDLLQKHFDYFSILLWKYLHFIYSANEALKAMQKIVFQILHYQTLMCELEEIIVQKVDTAHFHPLTKSIFRLI